MATVIGNLEDMLFFPYNSEQDDSGAEDRLYDSQDWRDYFRWFIGNGTFPNPSNGMKVESLNSSMVLTLRMGAAFAEGAICATKKDALFSVTPSHLTLGRRDIVIVRHDLINRTIMPHYIEGTASSVPIVPPIVRTDDVFDLKLCEITVNPNAQAITQANILDTRLNSAVCGIVHGLVDQVDTTDIFNQYHDFLNKQIALWNTIRDTQETDWQEQTAAQQSAWQTQTTTQQDIWEAWFARIGVDIQIIATFNFDNLAALDGTEKLTSFPSGKMLEVITISGSSAKVAERESDFAAQVTTERVYSADGTIARTATITKTFPDGGIKDVITL